MTRRQLLAGVPLLTTAAKAAARKVDGWSIITIGNLSRNQYWGEPNDKVFQFRGHREAGKYLVSEALRAGIDMSYSYRTRAGDGVGHAFANTLLFLDWDRKGFDYPVVPISVNAYGRRVISYQGGILERSTDVDPPSPSPARCFALGQSVAKAIRQRKSLSI